MIKTVYRICRDTGETSTSRVPYSFTPEELVDDYMNSTDIDYKVISKFDNIDEALYVFNSTPCAPAQLRKTSYGYYFYLYEIRILQAVVIGDEGEILDIEWLSKKASSINV